MKEVRIRKRTIRCVWTFGIPLAFEETFGDRERRKAELGSNAKLAQAQEILPNIVGELSPGRHHHYVSMAGEAMSRMRT